MSQESIKKQLLERLPEIIQQLEKGKDLQISYQKSKNKLHLKSITVEKL